MPLHFVFLRNSPETKIRQEDQIYSWFVDVAREKLGIALKEVKISFAISQCVLQYLQALPENQ